MDSGSGLTRELGVGTQHSCFFLHKESKMISVLFKFLVFYCSFGVLYRDWWKQQPVKVLRFKLGLYLNCPHTLGYQCTRYPKFITCRANTERMLGLPEGGCEAFKLQLFRQYQPNCRVVNLDLLFVDPDGYGISVKEPGGQELKSMLVRVPRKLVKKLGLKFYVKVVLQ